MSDIDSSELLISKRYINVALPPLLFEDEAIRELIKSNERLKIQTKLFISNPNMMIIKIYKYGCNRDSR